VHGASGFCRALGTQDLMKKEEEVKLPTFPCCMSRGKRKRNSVAQNETVLLYLFIFIFVWGPKNGLQQCS